MYTSKLHRNNKLLAIIVPLAGPTGPTENKIVFSERMNESLLMAGSLILSGNQFHVAGPATEKARRP